MCEKKLLQDIKCTGFPNHWLSAGTLFLIAPNPLQNVSLNLTILQLFNLFKEILIFPVVTYASLHYFWSNTVPIAFPGTKVLTLFFFSFFIKFFKLYMYWAILLLLHSKYWGSTLHSTLALTFYYWFNILKMSKKNKRAKPECFRITLVRFYVFTDREVHENFKC